MKVGASRGKVAILAVLGLVLVYFLYSNFQSDEPSYAPASVTPPPRAAAPDALPETPATAPRERRPVARAESRPLRLTFKDKKADATTVDPTIRFDLLAKVQQVTLEGGVRNLFQFGAAPLPPRPEPKIAVNAKAVQAAPVAVVNNNTPAAAPAPPPPPPIPLKFFGYSSATPGLKKAFFLQGEEIVVAAEGEMVQKRYRIVRIGVNSCVVEDTHYKHQQTLQMEEAAG